MSRTCLLSLLLLSIATAAQARDISGEMTYRERIALPEGAGLRVQLRGAEGIVSEVRVDPAGRQVPLPFGIVAPDGEALVLQGAIFDGTMPRWVSVPVEVAPGDEPLDLGAVPMTRDVAQGFLWRMRCGATVIQAGFAADQATLRVAGEMLVLPQAMSASGARYADGAEPPTEFWNKGDKAMLTLRGETLPECAPMLDRPLLPLTARGNEPFWRLDLTETGYALETMGAAKREGRLPPGAILGEGRRFEADGLVITAERGLCHDTMTGMPFPLSVTIEEGGTMLAGCGGLPADLLAGGWRVAEVAGGPVPEGVEVTLDFSDEAARVSGSGGCNRYNGAVDLSGEGLRFGPAASTMMACPEPQMAAELAFHKALAAVDRFDIGTDGGLQLIAGSEVVIRAMR